MALNILNNGDLLCVSMEGRSGNNDEDLWKEDHGLEIKNNLPMKDE